MQPKDALRFVAYGHIALSNFIWEGVDTPCHEWYAKTDAKGYGRFWLAGQWRQAHRIAWQYLNDDYTLAEMPLYFEELKPTLDHKCSNRRCVRRSHLEPCSLKKNHQLRAQRYWERKRKMDGMEELF